MKRMLWFLEHSIRRGEKCGNGFKPRVDLSDCFFGLHFLALGISMIVRDFV